MKATTFLLVIALTIFTSSAHELDSARFLRAMQSRRLDGGRCWSWCKNGESSALWSWWGWAVNCACHDGWTGKCCDQPKTCQPGPDICPFNRMEPKTAQCKDALNVMRIAYSDSGMPKNLQGVFWLQNQKDSSALCSFAKSNDGGKLSTGALDPEAKYHYSIRVGGDRVWSFHDKATSWDLVEKIDLVYNFQFDDVTNPTKADIIPESLNLGLELTQQFLLNFDMNLLDESQKTKFKGVVTWGRPSSVLGIDVDDAYYELVQVIDGEGKPTAAFKKWQEYCDSDVTGTTNGEFHYREASN